MIPIRIPNPFMKVGLLFLLVFHAMAPATIANDESNLQTLRYPSSNLQPLTSMIRFERITVEHGLSQNAVLTILQDRVGFMWFGTEDGLNKYDGYMFEIFKHDPETPTTIADNLVSKLYEDSNGRLWVGTRSGLDQYDQSTGTFIHYQNDPADPDSLSGTWVTAILEDPEGRLWIGTDDGGLNQLIPETGRFEHYLHDPNNANSLSSNSVRSIFQEQDGDLWIGTREGLDRFDPEGMNFTHYENDSDDPGSLSNNNVSAILQDQFGILWIATEGGGLNRWDPHNNSFTHYQNDPDELASLSHDRIRALFEDQEGRFWVGTQNGLDQLDRRNNQFIHFKHDPGNQRSLSSNSIWSIYEDRTGLLWFGTYGGGLSKYSRSGNQFTLYQHQANNPDSLSDNMIWSIAEDVNDNVWIGTFNGGLNKLDPATNSFTVYQHDPENENSLSSNDVRTILEDPSGGLWIGTSDGLDLLDPKSGDFLHYRHDPDIPDSLSENRVLTLLKDRSGNLWVGTRTHGLNKMDPSTGSFTHYRHDPENPSSLSDDRIWALYQDHSGAIWIGTLGGLNLWDEANAKFIRYRNDPDDPQSLSNDAIFSIYEDADNAIWIGTWGNGLDRFDRETQTFHHYTEKEGLSNNVIYGIEADLDGNLWLSTNAGLSKFNPREETFKNYDVRDGLQNNEFNVGAHFSSLDGKLYFGGIEGFNAFYPEQIIGNVTIPPIVITSFAKFNQPVEMDFSSEEVIELSYRDNFISFEYAVLDFNAPDKNLYAYMLDGFDQDWIEAGTRRYASYTNLEGGDYTFRAKGSNADGIWNEEGVSIRISVAPPYWETWWFIGIVIFLAAAGIFTGYRLRVKSIETRSRELENLIEERTFEIEQRTQELETLYRADEELYRHLQVDEVLQTLIDIALDILKADKCSLLVWDDADENLVVRTARGFNQVTLEKMIFAPGEGTIGLVAASGEPIIVEDVDSASHVDNRYVEPEGIRSSMYFPIKIREQMYGVFNAHYCQPRGFGEDEQRLFSALAQRAASAIQNAQLYEAAQELAVVEERSRLARDLHDAVSQTLFSASLIAEVLPRIWDRDLEQGQQRLAELRDLTRGALAEMRTLLLELRPTALIESDLGDLLQQLAESITGRARIPVQVKIQGDSDLSVDVKVAFYRIAQEALNNVAKHSSAENATVNLDCETNRLELQVTDDGQGFNPSGISIESLGLGIMQERAISIGAQLDIDSQVGEGTIIKVTWEKHSEKTKET